MDIKKIFSTDSKAEQEGVWVDLDKKTAIKVARSGNPKFQKLFRKLTKPYTRAMRSGTLNDDIAEKILIQCLAETILLDWKGIEEDGKKVPYSVEKAIEYLGIKDFRDFVVSCADDFALYKAEQDEETAKN